MPTNWYKHFKKLLKEHKSPDYWHGYFHGVLTKAQGRIVKEYFDGFDLTEEQAEELATEVSAILES